MPRIKSLGVGILCVLVIQTLGTSDSDSQTHSGNAKECQATQDQFANLKIGHSSLVPDSKIHDEDMEICYRGPREREKKSCCSRKMERKYEHAAGKDFYEIIRSTSSYLKNLLSSNAAHYEDQFITKIQAAQNATERLLQHSYKIPIRDRRAPLSALFMDLQAFIKRREVNIHDSVEQFFDELFPLVFHNIMSDPSVTDLSEDYRECLMEIRKDLNPQPFGGVPPRLKHHLAKSLMAARLFLEALNLGIETINTTDHATLEKSCSKSLTKLTYCSHCEGYVLARPCKNFCFNVIRGCLASATSLDNQWDSFIDALAKLVSNMKGSFDIEEVLHSLHSKLSEAIMHAMETGHKFYAKVVSKCGHLKASKSPGVPRQRLEPNIHTILTKEDHKPKVKLHTKIEMFMRNLVASKGFYSKLADTVCNGEKIAAHSGQECWNGQVLGHYNESVVENKLESQILLNPEVRVPERRPSVYVTLKDKLIHVTKLLNSKASQEVMQSDDWSPAKGGKRRGGKTSQNYEASGDNYGYVSDDEEDWTKPRSKGTKPRYNHYGSGDNAGYVDDEDYEVEWSGSGSGDDAGYEHSKSNPGVHRTPHKRPGAKGNPNDEFYLEGENQPKKNRSPYIEAGTRRTPESDYMSPLNAALPVRSTGPVVIAMLVSIVMWLHG